MAYHIARDNQQLGVFDEADLQQKLASGEFRSTDLCWTEGMAEWKPLGQVNLTPASPPPVFGGSELNPYAPPTTQNLSSVKFEGNAPLATLGQRFAAALIDGLTFLIVYIPLILGLGIDAAAKIAENPEQVDSLAFAPNWGLVGLAGILLLGLIVVNIIMLAKRGQTIGKRVMAIRIVDVEQDVNPGWVRTIILRSVVNTLIAMVPILGGLYSIVDILFIFGQERRCIHDLIATTRVIQGQPS
jgi:uncharacterized RDD family membrane protein YckC